MRLFEFSPSQAASPRTLYVCRPLLNAEDLIEWAQKAGFESCLPASEMHVTIAYSKERVRWGDTAPMQDRLRVSGGQRRVAPLGGKGASVLLIDSTALQARWANFVNEVGCSWDYDGYRPHVSISYRPTTINLRLVQPFGGTLVFGPERFSEINGSYSDNLEELALA